MALALFAKLCVYPQVYIPPERLPFFNLHSSILASRGSSGRSCNRQLLYMTPVSFTQIPHKVFSAVLPALCCFVLSSLHLSFASRKLILLKVLNYFSLLGIRQMLPWRIIFAVTVMSPSVESGIYIYILAFSLSTHLLQNTASLIAVYIPPDPWVNDYSLVH